MINKLGYNVNKCLLYIMNGEQLKKLRLNANLTQSELAEKLGTYKQKISNWENGLHTISRLYVNAIKEYFQLK